MASDKEEMWSDVKNVVIKHVSDGNPVDYALAEYLGRTVFNDYRVRSFKLIQPLRILPDVILTLH